MSVGRRNIQNLSKKVAQGYNEKGDGSGFPVLIYKTNIYHLRCKMKSVSKCGTVSRVGSCFRFVINASICIVNIRSVWQLLKKEKNSWVSFIFPLHDEYGAPLGGPSGHQSSAKKKL